MNSNCSTRSKGAFTLIEVLLATAIFSIVLVAINTIFFAALTLRQRTSDVLEESLPLNRALAVLRRDLQNALPPSSGSNSFAMAGDFRSGSSGAATTAFSAPGTGSRGGLANSGMAQNGGLDFFTSTGALSDDQPWGDIQEVNYQLMEPLDRTHALGKDLVRSVVRNLLAASTQAPEVQRLAGNIQSLDFSYYDGTQWRDTWDTSAGDSGLPLAVRARVQLASDPATGARNLEPLEMVVLLEGQSATNQTRTATGGTR